MYCPPNYDLPPHIQVQWQGAVPLPVLPCSSPLPCTTYKEESGTQQVRTSSSLAQFWISAVYYRQKREYFLVVDNCIQGGARGQKVQSRNQQTITEVG